MKQVKTAYVSAPDFRFPNGGLKVLGRIEVKAMIDEDLYPGRDLLLTWGYDDEDNHGISGVTNIPSIFGDTAEQTELRFVEDDAEVPDGMKFVATLVEHDPKWGRTRSLHLYQTDWRFK